MNLRGDGSLKVAQLLDGAISIRTLGSREESDNLKSL